MYDKFTFLYPPRPEQAIPSNLLSYYEDKGWSLQTKCNGTNNIIAVAPDGSIRTWNRHNESHKAWTPTEESMHFFKQLESGWYVFVAELLHSKVSGIRDTNYVHDILVYKGEHLVGTTQEGRQTMLSDLFVPMATPVEHDTHYALDEKFWLTREYKKGFLKFYNSLSKPEFEGVVLKNPQARLGFCYRQSDNQGTQIKCRRATKNYGF